MFKCKFFAQAKIANIRNYPIIWLLHPHFHTLHLSTRNCNCNHLKNPTWGHPNTHPLFWCFLGPSIQTELSKVFFGGLLLYFFMPDGGTKGRQAADRGQFKWGGRCWRKEPPRRGLTKARLLCFFAFPTQANYFRRLTFWEQTHTHAQDSQTSFLDLTHTVSFKTRVGRSRAARVLLYTLLTVTLSRSNNHFKHISHQNTNSSPWRKKEVFTTAAIEILFRLLFCVVHFDSEKRHCPKKWLCETVWRRRYGLSLLCFDFWGKKIKLQGKLKSLGENCWLKLENFAAYSILFP